MTVQRGNGGKIPLLVSTIAGGDPIFVRVTVTGKTFISDLVTDPTDPAQAAAAIGSDLELLTEFMSNYGTIIGIELDSQTAANFIMGYGNSFNDPATSQDVFDKLTDDFGWTVTEVYASRNIRPDTRTAPL